LTQGERTDCTLSGPTTTAWFVPWRRHLVRQGVQFIQGRLLELREQAGRVIAIVESHDVRTGAEGQSVDKVKTHALDLDYYVVATTAGEAKRLAHGVRFQGCECEKIARLELGNSRRANPGQLSDHMAGIQYYFRSPLSVVKGHTVYPDSEWGL